MSLNATPSVEISDRPFSWNPPCQWFAVHTRSHFESRVAVEFADKGVEHYLPVRTSLHQWKDRRKQVSLPLFPGYLFCRIADTAPARLQVLQTTGVARILGCGSHITAVPEVQIHSIRRMLESNVPWEPHPYLQRGAVVRIRSGPLRDLQGILVRTKTRTRLVLSVELLCQSIAAEVDAYDVEVLSPSHKQAIAG